MFARSLRLAAPLLARTPTVVRQVGAPASLFRAALAPTTPFASRAYGGESRPARERPVYPPSERLFVGRLPEGTDTEGACFRSLAREAGRLLQLHPAYLPQAVRADPSSRPALPPSLAALLDICKEFGATSAEVLVGHEGRPRNFGFVQFSSIDEATAAINSITTREAEGEPLVAAFAQSAESREAANAARRQSRTESGPPSPQLFVGNLSEVQTENLEQQLTDKLDGKTFQLSRGYYRETGVLHPFAFLRFESTDESTDALGALGDLEVDGRRLTVSFPRQRSEDGPSGARSGGRRGRCVLLTLPRSCAPHGRLCLTSAGLTDDILASPPPLRPRPAATKRPNETRCLPALHQKPPWPPPLSSLLSRRAQGADEGCRPTTRRAAAAWAGESMRTESKRGGRVGNGLRDCASTRGGRREGYDGGGGCDRVYI